MNYHVCQGRFANRNVLVTGGAGGIGFACASRMAAEGAGVGLIDLDADALADAAGRLSDEGHEVYTFDADVTDAERVDEIVSSFHSSVGSVDALVTMAGIAVDVDLESMTFDQAQRTWGVNVGGTMICARAAMRVMREQQYGRIVTVSSGTILLGLFDPPANPAYVASRAGVIGLTRSLARGGGPDGITVNCVLPGLTATDAVLGLDTDVDALFDMIVGQQCVKRRGLPQDLAEAVAYLASEGSGFVTGQPLYVGGGDRFV